MRLQTIRRGVEIFLATAAHTYVRIYKYAASGCCYFGYAFADGPLQEGGVEGDDR